MRITVLALAAAGTLALSYFATAAPPAKRTATVPPVISSHQIDRFDAIAKTKAKLAAEPNSLADWIILGELANEAALQLPHAQARPYVRMSREAYERALALAPDNAGITAAVQFARDLDANFDQFGKSRDQATDTYLAARRRDLALAGYAPAIAVYDRRPAVAAAAAPKPVEEAAPVTDPTVVPGRVVGADAVTNPPPESDPNTASATYGARLYYGTLPVYRSYVGVNGAPPLTYETYLGDYYPPGVYSDPAALPVTPQRIGVIGVRAVNDSGLATPPLRPR